tara:strand:+ start:78 stop:617 length:540 start_codon:yes stop_codon:yes gene_type:complete
MITIDGGTGVVTGGTGGHGLRSPGSIVQTIQTVKTDTDTIGTTDTFTDISGLSATITPTSTTSKVLVMVNLSMSGPDQQSISWKILRGSTPVYIGDAAGSNRIRVAGSSRICDGGDAETMNCTSIFLDSPSTTSSTTYKIQWARPYPVGQCYLNRPSEDSDVNDRARTPSSILLQEVAA